MNALKRLYKEADEKGIGIYYFPMRVIKAISTPDNIIAIDTDKLDTTYEEASCLAHEMGHCQHAGFYTVDTPLITRKRCEERANRWAYNKLVPKEELELAFAMGFTSLHELSELFEVPEDFVANSVKYYKEALGLFCHH